MSPAIDIIILAAGKGTRMRSQLPKVLHTLGGCSFLSRVVNTARQISQQNLHIVVGHGADHIKQAFSEDNSPLVFIEQQQQLGTGHAVQQVLPYLQQNSISLILYGDVPLISANTLKALVQQAIDTDQQHSLALLTLDRDDPSGYGRIIRDTTGAVKAIVEQKDADLDQQKITEINTGIMAISSQYLQTCLPKLNNNNAQNEYLLTDIVAMAASEAIPITTAQPDHDWEVEGINNRWQQTELERIYQWQQAKSLCLAGVSLADPQRFDCRGNIHCGQDVFIDVNCVIEGDVSIGNHVHIGPNCLLKNVTLGDYCRIEAHSILEDSTLSERCNVGPFARLRPGTALAAGAKVGNFVETKKAFIGKGSKINHLSYIGDAHLGASVNVGAGTITCNYDGVNKHQTTIGDKVFVGSNSSLVAPLTLADNATVGAGSTITKNVEKNTLALSRSPQKTLTDWARPQKKDTP